MTKRFNPILPWRPASKQQSQPVFLEGASSENSDEVKKGKISSALINSEVQTFPADQQDPVQQLLDKGVDFFGEWQPNKALEVFQEVVRITPRSSEGYFGLGMVYEHRKDWVQATHAYQQAIACNPDDVLAQENLKFAKKTAKKIQPAIFEEIVRSQSGGLDILLLPVPAIARECHACLIPG
jgi:tetratricopeptide (TPR) repeat protein